MTRYLDTHPQDLCRHLRNEHGVGGALAYDVEHAVAAHRYAHEGLGQVSAHPPTWLGWDLARAAAADARQVTATAGPDGQADVDAAVRIAVRARTAELALHMRNAHGVVDYAGYSYEAATAAHEGFHLTESSHSPTSMLWTLAQRNAADVRIDEVFPPIDVRVEPRHLQVIPVDMLLRMYTDLLDKQPTLAKRITDLRDQLNEGITWENEIMVLVPVYYHNDIDTQPDIIMRWIADLRSGDPARVAYATGQGPA